MTKKYLHKIYGGWGCDSICCICGIHEDEHGTNDLCSMGGGRYFEKCFVRGEKGYSHCIELIPEDRFGLLRKKYKENDFIICGLADKYPSFKQKLKEIQNDSNSSIQ